MIYQITNVFWGSVLVFAGVFQTSNAMAQQQPESWSNPNLIQGSTFGNIFQGLYKIGRLETLLSLTASESRRAFGDQAIIKYYSVMQFSYPLKLISSKRNNNTWTLTYRTTITATEFILRMNVVVENDTCRLILPTGFNKQQYFLTTWK